MASKPKRRLAAVWFVDIVGYTGLSSRDEDAALAVVSELRRLTQQAVASVEGRIVKFVGDGALAVFDSADAALRSAVGLRDAFLASETARRHASSVRIGVHVGEVVESDGDVYGDGVNVASRIEGKAEPGQVVVSDDVYRLLRQQPGYGLKPIGAVELKGLDEPMRLYAPAGSGLTSPAASTRVVGPRSSSPTSWEEDLTERLDLKGRLFQFANSKAGLGLGKRGSESWAEEWLETWPRERAAEYIAAFEFARSEIKKGRRAAEAFADKWLSESVENEFYRYADLFDFLSHHRVRKSATATESLADELVNFDDAELGVFKKAYEIGRSMGKSRSEAEYDALQAAEEA